MVFKLTAHIENYISQYQTNNNVLPNIETVYHHIRSTWMQTKKLRNSHLRSIISKNLEKRKFHSGTQTLTVCQGLNDEPTKRKKSKTNVTGYLIGPNVSFDEIGGCEDIKDELRDLIILPTKYPFVYENLRVKPPKAVLLYGPSGSGKSMVSKAVAKECNASLMYISASEMLVKGSGESESKLRNIFEESKKISPCILVIDDIDVMCSSSMMQRGSNIRLITQLISCLDDIHSTINDVFVIATTTKPESIDKKLRRGGRFEHEIAFNLPNKHARTGILRKITKQLNIAKEVDINLMGAKTVGYVGSDLCLLVKEAVKVSAKRIFGIIGKQNYPNRLNTEVIQISDGEPIEIEDSVTNQKENKNEMYQITMDDFALALKKITPGFQKEGFTPSPKTTWDEIGGLDELHEELKLSVVYPVLYPDIFAKQGLEQPCGILMYGPPGCGKTLVAKALANEASSSFIFVKGPELLNSLVGETEKAIRSLFSRAVICSPCLIFFDEIESLVPRRQTLRTSSEVSLRVVTQLLTELDGLEDRKGVYVVAATNRPDMIDRALLRPGRLGRSIYIPLPNQKGREQIFLKHLRNVPFGGDMNLAVKLAEKSVGYSGADCANVVRKAASFALKNYFSDFCPTEKAFNIQLSKHRNDKQRILIKSEHFDTAIAKSKRSVTEESNRFYERIRKQIDNDIKQN